MTDPTADVTVQDGATTTDPGHDDQQPIVEDPPDNATLAEAGILTGDALAAHLREDGDLEAHAQAMLEQGPPDGTEAPPGAEDRAESISAVQAWLKKPVYTELGKVGTTTLYSCGLCGQAIADRDAHTADHERRGA